MKLSLLLILFFCYFGLGKLRVLGFYEVKSDPERFPTAFGDDIVVTKPPFIRSRYSLRYGKTKAPVVQEPTAGPVTEPPRTTAHPKVATSTANADYDYYGNVDAENVVHK
ncbi:hypothetical protein KR018_005809 [Drosophila ironensis]|nr:hypothetical protein KR018_005809 [Drosophila ironensis]